MSEKRSVYHKFCRYAIEFVLCGITGWVYETVLTSIVMGEFVHRGYLHIPVLPIYGVFGLILMIIFRKKQTVPFIFFVSVIATTVLELIGAYAIEAVLHRRLWSYEDWPLNFFEGRVSVLSSIIFGILSLFLMKVIHPFSDFLDKKLPSWAMYTAGTLCWASIAADFAVTALNIV